MQESSTSRKVGWKAFEFKPSISPSIAHVSESKTGVFSIVPLSPSLQKSTHQTQVVAHPTFCGFTKQVSSLRRCNARVSALFVPFQPTQSTSLHLLLATLVLLCLLWTLWLILLHIAPNFTVNKVMNTEDLDHGVFWLLIDPPPFLYWLSTIGLSLASTGYLTLLFKIMSRSTRRVRQAPGSLSSISKPNSIHHVPHAANPVAPIPRTVTSSASSLLSLASFHRRSRHFALGMKVGDLVFETLVLVKILEAGSPVPIVVVFTLLIVANAVTCALTMFLPIQRTGLLEPFVDLFFDLLLVVLCPLFVLIYCLSAFTFPRALYAINRAVFPPATYEQLASVVADPAQTAVIYKSLKSLRIASVLDLVARIGVHVTLTFRFHHLVHLLHRPWHQHRGVYPRHHRIAALGLVIYALLILVFVAESMRTSSLACASHPECVIHARRWTLLQPQSVTQCPCRVLIDRDVAPTSYAEWIHPRNVMDKVAQLATSGDLEAIQLTNRDLPTFPSELRRCTQMIHLTLEYTHTTALPPWMNEWTSLEYLHVEQTFTSPSMMLPDHLFDAMTSLTFLHLAGFVALTHLPSFQGLGNLKSLALAVLLHVDHLPSFAPLSHLERLFLTGLPSLETLPDLAPLATTLQSLTLIDRGTWCCNGFLGTCDLHHPMCQVHPLYGTPAASCLATEQPRASPGTVALLQQFPATVCTGLLYPGILEGPPTQAMTDPCNGTLYRQCSDPSGKEAMCYNARFMAIACDTNPYPIEMRRRQIAQGLATPPCDPDIEAWLGCS